MTARHRLLIVEDDPEIQYLLSIVLEAENREIVTASSRAEAWAALSETPFDLVVLDLILPDADGRTLLTEIRGRTDMATAPVVVVSARSDPKVRQECYALGATFYTEKPFDPDEVADEVEARLKQVGEHAGPNHLDPRTGLLNRAGIRRGFESRTEAGAIALVQIDAFHDFSDRWGWDLASELIETVGRAIAEQAGDVSVGRLGAGDFVLFSVGSDSTELGGVCEAVLDGVRGVSLRDPDGESLRITASIGVVDVNATAPLDDGLDEARRRLFRAHDSGRNQVVATDEDIDASALRIIVAEDDDISATILLHRLEREGLDLVRYDNGRDALNAAMERTPHLVILDVKMPGMDGFEVLEALRRSPTFDDVPVIMLTSMGAESDVVRAFQLGVDDYVLKPFSPIELSARVWRLLRRGRAAGQG